MMELRFLGEQRVVVDGQNVTSAVPPRMLDLMAYLALRAGQDVPRAAVASAFWPESSDEQALTNLRRELYGLRQRLPGFAASIETAGRGMRWELGPEVSCDVVRFVMAATDGTDEERDASAAAASAGQAVDAYSGELLPTRGEEWLLDERARLHRMCVDLIDRLLARSGADVDPVRQIALASRRIELEPFEEPGYRLLMSLQADAGDRAGALTTFHRCSSILERELGVPPDPATVQMYESLLVGARQHPVSPSGTVRSAGRVPLVGRGNEMHTLHNKWDQALLGDGGLHLIVGEPGVGKSRLLSEFAVAVERDGNVVARARSYSARSRLSMAPLAEWLSATPLRVHQSSLSPAWQTEVRRLVPTEEQSEEPRVMIDAWQRYRFFEGLTTAMLAPQRPTLLTLDDIQWCDGETLAWLQFFLRRTVDNAVLIVASGREEEFDASPDLTTLLASLRAENLLTKTELTPLPRDLTAELARRAGAASADGDAVFAATKGFPLFVIESARVGGGGSSSIAKGLGDSQRVQAVLDGRLDQLSEDAATVAGLAAVIGREFSPQLLERASDAPAERVVDGLDELWRRRIIVHRRRGHQGHYDFSHDLLRDATLRRIPPPRLGALHRRVAEALEQETGADAGTLAGRIADHFERAGLGSRALPFHERAAALAVERYGHEAAIAHYQAACRLLAALPESPERDRHELRLRHAISAPLNARYGFSATALEGELTRALALSEGLGDTRLEVLSLVGLFSTYVVQGRIVDSYDVSRRALDSSGSEPEVLGQAHFAVAGSATMLGLLDEGLEHFEMVPPLTMEQPPSIVGTRPEVHSMAWQSHALWLVDRTAEAREHLDWAIRRAEHLDHAFSLAVALAYSAMLAQFDEDRGEVAEIAGRTSELCRKHGFTYYGHWAQILAGWATGGHRGLEEIDAGLSALDAEGALIRRSYYLSLRADLQVSFGDREGACNTLRLARRMAVEHSDLWWLPELLRRLARLESPERAADLLAEAKTLAQSQRSVRLARRVASDLDRSEQDPTALVQRTPRERSAP